MAKRIITVTSGKGGVGKTTLAINLGIALSRYGRTILVDQDFETGSVRSFMNMPIRKDLYHFVAKRDPLADCITPLPPAWDPEGRYKNFGVIATPRHYIEEVAHVHARQRRRFVDALHRLPADFILLDMKAGLAKEILDSMPYSNSGILIFTPNLPAATGAAAYLIKAQIFRKLHLALEPPSPLVRGLSPIHIGRILELLHRADDVYDDGVPNLDRAQELMAEELGGHPAVRAVERTLSTFRIHYVLNHFDGVEASYEKAVKPFVEKLVKFVSARLQIRNLGWIEMHPDIHEANCSRIPALLYDNVVRKPAAKDTYLKALADVEHLAEQLVGPTTRSRKPQSGLEMHLGDQLDQLSAMYGGLQGKGYADQFRYIASSALHLMDILRKYSFGDTRLLTPSEVRDMLEKYHQS